MKKLLSVLTLASLCLFVLPGATSCEQKAEEAVGVNTVTDPSTGKATVTVDPSGGPVGSVVKTAAGIAATVAPGPGTIASIAANGVLTVLVGIFAAIAKKRAGQLSTSQVALSAANTAINATASGLQAVVNTLPADHAATLVHVIDLAHDAANVAGHLQDLIQPTLQTAGSTTPAPVVAGTPTV